MRYCIGILIATFCVKINFAQKVSFLYKPDPILFEKFETEWNKYLLGKPQIPVSFNLDNGGNCAFDGFGFNKQPQFLCTCNNLDAAKTIGTNQLWTGGALGLNINGTGLNKLALWDGGSARTTHHELTGRVQIVDSPNAMSSHTTAVIGNLMATGINPLAKGMAYQTIVRNWNFTNDNAEIIGAAPSLFLSNHSYGSTVAWQYIGGSWYWYGDSVLNQTRDWKFGYYDNRSRIWDSVMVANPYYLMVKAAGNDRGSGVAPGTTHYYWNGNAWALSNTTRDTVGPYDCMATFGCAKNILTIGAAAVLPNGYAGPSSVNILSYSSWGPTDDGRIKPDLVAASGNILSTGSANDSAYATLGGTSMAAPNVTGSLLLLQQYHQQLKGKYMRNATLKTLAIHTADRCKNALGPNYECGWGLPNMPKAANCISDSVYSTLAELSLNNNDTFTAWIYTNGTDTVKTTMGWTDPKGNTLSPAYNDTTLQLVNDLDLRLLNTTGSIIRSPFVLNPANPALAATTGDNFRDNIEQVFATGLSAGFYQIRVTHKSQLLAQNVQPFALLLSGAKCEPLIGSTNIILSNIQNNQMQVTFTKGNGQRRLVFVKAGASVTNFPINGTAYTASSVFGSGQNLGNNTYVVYNDTGNQFLLSGLNPLTQYFIAVAEYNGSGLQCLYATKQLAVSNGTTLPVTWLNLNASQLDNFNTEVKWSTAREINNALFDIEFSADNQNFNVVYKINGKGNSHIISNYKWVHYFTNGVLENCYYRIKQTDFDGKFSYSKTIYIHTNVPWKLNAVYPNPFSSMITLSITSSGSHQLWVQVFSLVGETVYQGSLKINNSGNYPIDLINLKDGMYFLMITDETDKQWKANYKILKSN